MKYKCVNESLDLPSYGSIIQSTKNSLDTAIDSNSYASLKRTRKDHGFKARYLHRYSREQAYLRLSRIRPSPTVSDKA